MSLVTAIATLASYIIMIGMNLFSANISVIGGKDNKTISDTNPTYLTPDGVTFAIWGIIYLGELCFAIYQLLPSNIEDKGFVAARPYVIGAFLLNSIWIVIFAFEFWWLSWLIICGYLLMLSLAYKEMKIDYRYVDPQSEDYRSPLFKALSYVGFSANIAWVTVATAVNTTVTLRSAGFVTVLPSCNVETCKIGGSVDWAIMFVVIVAAVSITLSLIRGDYVHNLTTAWALSGIIRMQTTPLAERFPVDGLSNQLASWALAFEIVVLVVTGVIIIKNIYEAFFQPRTGRLPTSSLANPML